ncbi:UDP-glucose 4-epimerase family protein [Aestuariirhabdus haliotis]|uniref:UDP-glucose 4-epimerase family protein n=1 Tax=Aestuariirhabdus haliotis TaxID=2918751 RepID=UPI0020BEDFD0|nr:SDR family oxidoreductase [Aestuariirhabdus haliotis]MCL6419730.1 SDR family oxidoreductase [Aestuariirhabdus haliotis]
MGKILLTGATGFVGSRILQYLLSSQRYGVIAALRNDHTGLPTGVLKTAVGNIDSSTDWDQSLLGCEVVIHSAARVHVMNDNTDDPLLEFRRVNVEGTLNFARQAAKKGIRRFIFISSIKVNGEETTPGSPYCADDIPDPRDPYGISKMEAEQGLRNIADSSNMEVVIIRPVLVYGPEVKANFHTMMKWLYKGVPLPLGSINNSRSLVALDNLVDLIVHCIDCPTAANQTFLVSDGEDLSTTELLRKMSRALGKPDRLIPMPSILLKFVAALFGKRSMSQRLCGSLQVDITKTQELLKWTPPVSVETALQNTADHFLEQLR